MELLTQLMKVPSAALCLFALFFLLVALLKIKQVRLSVSMAASSGLMLAMAVILTAFPFYRMPNGGSVTLGGMLPLFFISFAYGPEVGIAGRFCLQSHEPCDGTIYPASCFRSFSHLSLPLWPWVLQAVSLGTTWQASRPPWRYGFFSIFFRAWSFLAVTLRQALRSISIPL